MMQRFQAYGIFLILLLPISPAFSALPTGLALHQIATGLNRPIAIRHANDNSGRLFIVEQDGVIRIINAAGQLLATPFLDISTRVDSTDNEQGLLGLAFDPDFSSNGYFYVNYFYVNYTRDPGAGLDRTRVARFTVSANPDSADSSSEFVIIEIEQDDTNHNGGDIHFSPLDGYLYIGMGDGGGGNDTFDNAQELDELNGKLLRIDVSSVEVHPSACGLVSNYRIPTDNPFLSTTGACAEIWARGLRNPWRWSFDRLNGDLFIGDVGQNAIEEVDQQPASSSGGENYGWPCMEGNTPRPGNSSCLSTPLTAPILDYQQGSTHCAVTGGYRYRGQIPGLRGLYFFADYCSGYIWYVENTGSWGVPQLWLDTSFRISAFGEDQQGELYLTDLQGGAVYRVQWGLLFETFEN